MSQFHIQSSVQNGVDRLFAFLPELIGALVLLILGYIVAKALQNGVRKLLIRARFDRALHVSPAGKYLSRLVESPAALVGRIVYWLVFFLFLSMAVSVLDIPVLNNILNGVFAYIPKVVAAVIIFLVASAITAGAEAFITKVLGRTPLAKLLGAVVPAITMSIAIFMILNQLEIATDIVNITYTAIMGSLALGLALAFGLGGRDVAARILEQAYETTQQNKETYKAQARAGSTNAKRMADDARDNL